MAERRIAVLLSLGRHPVSGAIRWSRNDAAALGLACHLAAANPAGTTITALHAGDPAEPALRGYLALGASQVQAIATLPGQDVLEPLAAHLADHALILCGSQTESGSASGLLPYLLAQRLGLPLLPAVLSAELGADAVRARQFLPKGRRRDLEADLPALLTVHPSAPYAPRYAYARERAGQIQALPPAVPAEPLADSWRIEPASARPRKLAAPEQRSGRDRLLAATAMASRGGVVIQHGSPEEKARAVLDYLRTHNLVDY